MEWLKIRICGFLDFKKINLDFKLAFIITTHNPKVAQIGEKKLLLEEGKLSILDNI